MESGVSSDTSILSLETSKCHIENGVNSNHIDLYYVTQLQLELENIKKELSEKNTECRKLQDDSMKVNAELEDLTASLFEEANKMVYDANVRRQKAEKKLAEAEGNIDALQTEVVALKSLVLTSTPSNPNPKSHPQIKKKEESKLLSPFRHKRTSSLAEAEKVKEPLPSSSCSRSVHEFTICNGHSTSFGGDKMEKEVDSGFYDEVSKWHRSLHNFQQTSNAGSNLCDCRFVADAKDASPLRDCQTIVESPFLSRVFSEDITLCLAFQNKELSIEVSKCIHVNSLSVELISNPVVLGKCALSGHVTQCRHRIRFGDSSSFHPISQSCRNRLTSVCDFLTYIRYVKQGIVKHTVEQIYWEIIRLRIEMTFARLGYFREQS